MLNSGNQCCGPGSRWNDWMSTGPFSRKTEANMIGSIIGWIVFGVIAGAIARLLHPGDDAMGIVGTILLGVSGSLIGGAIAYVLRLGTSPYEPSGWIFSILG